MRLVSWNIEHMNSWFVPNDDPTSPALRSSYSGRGAGGPIDDVLQLAQRAANVLNALDPDIICIQEGAGENEVTLFLNQFLPLPDGAGSWTVLGGSGGAQKLLTAVRTDRDVSSVVIADDSGMNVKLADDYPADTDGDGMIEEDTRFARVPLVVDVVVQSQNIRIINCHFKSKFVRFGERLFNGTQAERLEFIRAALVNRRRISAEAFRIRSYLDEIFAGESDSLLLLAGDLNDGPGFDFFERRYITHSVVDLTFGSVLAPEGRLTNPLIVAGLPRPATAFFDDFVEDVKNKPLFLDHFGLSPELSKWLDSARVANAEFDAEVQPGASNSREREPSDHRPIFVSLLSPA